ncbi:HAMP domain-containing protein [Candidatus Electronema halotolerans]|jgi:methyl-accepting chemotaxis protein
MNFLPKSGLQRQMGFYILFIGIVFLTMAVEMERFLRGDEVLGLLQEQMGSRPALELVGLILLKVRVMASILLLAIGLVMMLFIKRILFPLEQIIERTRAMSAGDFSVALPEESKDELGELARHINDLNANEQELILLVKNMAEQLRLTLAKGDVDEAMELLNELDETLAEFGRSFYRC